MDSTTWLVDADLAAVATISGMHRSGPAARQPQIQYAVDKIPGGRIVRSIGLQVHGQLEIGTFVDEHLPHEADHRVMDVLQFITNYVMTSGARIHANQTLAYGWTMLRFRDSRPSILEIEEDIEPLSGDHASHWGPGVQRAIALRLAGDEVMRRNRLTGQAEHPNRGHFALACVHITEAYTGMLACERREIDRSTTPWGSGWAIHCGAVDHTADQWHQHHLTHVVHPRPFVMPYLCMPERSMVVFDADGAIVWGPGANSGARDPNDPRSWRLSSGFADGR